MRKLVRDITTLAKRHPRRTFEILFFVSVLMSVMVCLTLVFRHQGWPQNHEGLSFMYRTIIYSDHFKQHDFFPIWSSSDAYGMGTPLPLFYHKVFYVISGSVLTIFGSVKFAIWTTLACLMLIGAYGIRLCVGKLRLNQPLALVAAVLFIFSNYAFGNWLVRGAMAEFTAMMFIPWLLYWCLGVIESRKLSITIVPILYLLFQSHNVTAVYSVVPLLFTVAYYVYIKRKQAIVPLIKFAGVSTVLMLVILLPQLILQGVLLRSYDPSKITQMGYMASENFRPIGAYLGTGYVWLFNWQQLNVGLDRAVWIVIIVCVCIYAFRTVMQYRKKPGSFKLHLEPRVLLLVASLSIYLFLQLPVSKFVYTTVPILQFLQFPWRLLAYITPLAILVCMYGVSWISRNNKVLMSIISTALTALTILGSPILRHYNYSFINTSNINNRSSIKYQGLESALMGIGEYLPQVYNKDGAQLSSWDTVGVYMSIADKNGTSTKVGDCTVNDISPRQRLEQMERRFKIVCEAKGYAYLPISYSPLMRIHSVNNNERFQVARIRTDPRAALYVDTKQPKYILVGLPRFNNILD